ncbi:histone H1.10 [Pristis pectinata]|uniref:histone H1.10 n=1 Tax=Pristis pectinata TaxID=685728 RepID=UPI00223DA250|nr:histone H1.10 [Pristis pectinata]
MAAEVESRPVAAADEEEEEEKKITVKKSGSKKKKNQQGKYSSLLVEIVQRLASRNGSSLAMICKEARKVPWFDDQHGRIYLRYALRALLLNGTLNQVKGKGANGSFKLTKKRESGQAAKKKCSASGSANRSGKKSSKKPESRKSQKGKSHSGSSSKSKKGKASKKSKSKKA